MFNLRCATESAVSAMLLLAVPSFSQTANGWPFAGNDLNNSRWASAETILNKQNVSGLTVQWQFTTQNGERSHRSVAVHNPERRVRDPVGGCYRRLCLLSRLVRKPIQIERGYRSSCLDAQNDGLWSKPGGHVAHHTNALRHDGDRRRECVAGESKSVWLVSFGAERERRQSDLEHGARSQPEFRLNRFPHYLQWNRLRGGILQRRKAGQPDVPRKPRCGFAGERADPLADVLRAEWVHGRSSVVQHTRDRCRAEPDLRDDGQQLSGSSVRSGV